MVLDIPYKCRLNVDNYSFKYIYIGTRCIRCINTKYKSVTADLEEAKLDTGESLSIIKIIFCSQRTSSLV